MEFKRLECALNRIITELNVPGVDCIVYKQNKEVFRYFKGYSDLENKVELKGDEQYTIFSMTKMLTCTAALQLMEKGKYNLDDPLHKFFPEFKNMKIAPGGSLAKETITIRNLFTMSAGLNYSLGTDYIKKSIDQGKTSTVDIVRSLSNTVLGFEPGTRFEYSLCHDVLGGLIEIWSGMKLSKYMEKYLFEPLGMTDTFFAIPKNAHLVKGLAKRYTYNSDGFPELLPDGCPFNITPEYESGGAGLVSTTRDYAIFLDALANEGLSKNGVRILNPQTVRLMKTNQLNDKQLDDFGRLRPGYGYGLGVRTHLNPSVSGISSPVGEFGWDGAAGAISLVDTINKISLTYFQHVHGWSTELFKILFNALYLDMQDIN